MLDPSWQVRHGALLGLLALVRAWQHSLTAIFQQQRNGETLLWPEDLLVRAMAILLFDRFGDFSGAFSVLEGASSDRGDFFAESTSYYQGGAVAPIRETAGQLIALLITLFPHRQRSRILDILQNYVLVAHDTNSDETEDLWEIRQGVLATFKYTTVLVWRNMEREIAVQKYFAQTGKRNESAMPASQLALVRPILDQVTGIGVEYLGDTSDDVVSAAAQILREITSSVTSSAFEGLNNIDALFTDSDIMPQLYQALHQSQSFSSSVPDLIALLSELLLCKSEFGRALASSYRLGDIFDTLSKLLDSDYESVQVSALTSLGSLSSSIGTLNLSGLTSESSDGAACTEDILPTCNQIVLRLFQFMLNHACEPHFEESTAGVQTMKTWRQLCRIFATEVFAHVPEAYHRLEKGLYVSFLRHQVIHASSNYFSVIDKGCEMLAIFSRTDKTCFPSRILTFVLDISFQAPWIAQCEAACVLYRHLAPEEENPIAARLGSRIHSLLTEEPLCLKTRRSPDGPDRLADSAIAQLCDDAVIRGIEMVGEGQDVESALNCVAVVCEQCFETKTLLSEGCKDSRIVEIQLMRLRASASAAGLVGRLPLKLTPFVRALMSSLKSESCEERLMGTVRAITCMLGSLQDSPSHAGSFSKILKALCDAAIKESRAVTKTKLHAACEGVRIVAQQTPISILQDDTCPIWTWLSALQKSGETSVDDILSAIHLLCVLCSNSSGTRDTASFFATKFVGVLTALCLNHETDEVRSAAISAIQCICSSKLTEALHLIFESVVEGIDLRASDHVRARGCHVLEIVVEVSGSALLPFIRSLFPIVMKLMRDRNTECSAAATSIFSSLVQLAPLVRLEESISVGSSQDIHTSAVVDHLILGKPIPPCKLPNCVKDALSRAGVSLRPYQEEGVSWLHFLQSVHLSGALCDSMGLGTFTIHVVFSESVAGFL